MTGFILKMQAEYCLTDENRQVVQNLVDKMNALVVGDGDQTLFSSHFSANNSALSLQLESANEQAQQKALMLYGPVLERLAQTAPVRNLKCSNNAPPALKAMLVPMEVSFVTM